MTGYEGYKALGWVGSGSGALREGPREEKSDVSRRTCPRGRFCRSRRYRTWSHGLRALCGFVCGMQYRTSMCTRFKQHEQACARLVCMLCWRGRDALCGSRSPLAVRRRTRTVQKEYQHSGTCMFFAVLDVPREQGWRCRCRWSAQGLLLCCGLVREEFVPC